MKDKKSESSKTDVFKSAPVSVAVFKNAVPAMFAMLMVLVYNLADTFFIGQTHNALEVSAVSLATPVFLFFMAVGTIFGIGGTSVISRALGEGRSEYAKKVCAFCMWACVLVGTVMSVLFLVFMNPILRLVGASDDTWEMTKQYLVIVSFSGPFVLIANCFNNIIRAEGQSAKAMMGQLIGNALNVVLDPLFILVFRWGVPGAAVATVIGNVVGAGYYIVYFLKGNSVLSVNIKYVTVKEKVLGGVLSIGIPASLGSVLMSVSQIVANARISAYGDMALAGYGVAAKVTMITGMICIGLGQGVQPLLGYCYGAKLEGRFRKIMRFSVLAGFLISIVMTGLCYLFASQIVGVFVSDKDAFRFGTGFVRILLTTSFLFGAYYVLLNAIQAVGESRAALILNISRQGIVFIPALFVLESFVGINGILWAQPVADIVSMILAAAMYFSWRRGKWESGKKVPRRKA